MTVHLIRSHRYDHNDFSEVVRFLTSFDGPIRFVSNEPLQEEEDEEVIMEKVSRENFYKQHLHEELELSSAIAIPRERLVESWKQLFTKCARYREKYRISKGDMVMLLTPVANEMNWFAAVDPDNPFNGFVHTGEWAHFVQCPETFPVAYLLITQVLRSLMFDTQSQAMEAVHQSPLGCFNDFCANKKEIILKLRTADICYTCVSLLKDKVEPLMIQQALTIFEAVRLRILFAQNFRQNVKPSPMVVTHQNRIFLSDYGNMEIMLTPLCKTLYLFFLRYPEGVMLHDLVDHRKELVQLYGRISNSGVLPEIMQRIYMVTDVTNNSASEKISRIKAVFTKAVGKDLADHYIIKGGNGQPKSIGLDRSLFIQQ